MQELEDFKYEFDFYTHYEINSNYKYADILTIGYIFLTQFTRQNIDKFSVGKDLLKEIISDSLEDGETIEVTENNQFILRLNEVNNDIIEYVQLILKCTLTLYQKFTVENNYIKWVVIDEN